MRLSYCSELAMQCSEPCAALQIVRTEFKPTIPSLVIVPNSSMSYWKGELEYWLGATAEVVFYTGPPGARQQIAASEFWLMPGALDGKVHDPKEQMNERVPKPDVVLISMESMIQVRMRFRKVQICGLFGTRLTSVSLPDSQMLADLLQKKR